MIVKDQMFRRGWFFMRTALILTTAATFLAHALLGCCWHHVHSAPAQTVFAQAASCCRHECACSSEMATADECGGEEAPPTAPSTCEEPGCVFVTTVPVGFSVEFPAASWLVSNCAAIVPLLSAPVAELHELAGLRGYFAGSMRSHLALGVLRI
jgi:hypothetical protein